MRSRLLAIGASLCVALAVGTVARLRPPSAVAARRVTPSGSLVGSIRGEPRSFNRYVARDLTTAVLTYLLHAGLVRVNHVTDQLEPEVAESWVLLSDQRTYRVRLRENVTFSDGVPLTAADVVFSFKAIYDERVESVLADSLLLQNRPLAVRAVDERTIDIRFPSKFAPGLRILDGVPILPSHKLAASLAAGQFRAAWGPATAPAEIVGLGPFVLRQYQPGQFLKFDRNPRYWRRENGGPLPHLTELVLQIVRDQDAEALALQTGDIDFTQSELRPIDIAPLKSATADHHVTLDDLGIGVDGDLFWINLSAARARDRRSRWLQHVDFRRAIAHAVDRTEFVNTVFLGAAVPGYGVVSPGNREWYATSSGSEFDVAASRRLLASLGFSERNGRLEDSSATSVQFTLVTQQGNTALERGAALIRDSLGRLGVRVDVVALETGALVDRLMKGDYDAAYFRLVTTDTDPALNQDFWRSAGSAHVWNPSQPRPATAWERQIDALMDEVTVETEPSSRRKAFAQVQDIMAREVPALAFAFPRLVTATSARLAGATPAPYRPPILWNPAVIGISRPIE
ncbi:MAG TPA: ABC transporter substrate-binding protein [Vicinamibacterales bacterium]